MADTSPSAPGPLDPTDVLRPGCLAGRVGLVTGGGTGIGRATALVLARLGAQVVIMGRRPEPLAETVALASPDAPPIMALPVDLREFDQVDAALDQVLAEHQRIDLLVNNAGGQFISPAEQVSANGFRAVTRLNLDAPWYLTTRIAGRSMIPQGYGKIVSVTMTPQRGIPYMAHSSAARAAIESLTQTLAVEWGAVRHPDRRRRAGTRAHAGVGGVRAGPRHGSGLAAAQAPPAARGRRGRHRVLPVAGR